MQTKTVMDDTRGLNEMRSSTYRSSWSRILYEYRHRFSTTNWNVFSSHHVFALSTDIRLAQEKAPDTCILSRTQAEVDLRRGFFKDGISR